MKFKNWSKYLDETVDTPCEIMFIDNNNQICRGNVNSLPTKDIVVLAYRSAVVKKPAQEKKFVAYWNWKTGKFWPFNAKSAPNPKLPNYFKLEVLYSDPLKIKYYIHSDSII